MCLETTGLVGKENMSSLDGAYMGSKAACLPGILLRPGLAALPSSGGLHLVRLGGGFNHGSIRPPPPEVLPPEEPNGLEQQQKLVAVGDVPVNNMHEL